LVPPEQIRKPSHSTAGSFLGSLVVLLSAVFLVLITREGGPYPYQSVIDAILHNWIAMAALTLLMWAVRKGWLVIVPPFFRWLSGFLFVFFVVFAGIGFVAWPNLWEFLRLFHVSQYEVQPVVGLLVIAVWFLTCVALLLRRFMQWIGKRYQHHGVAIGFGPLYFYFRRRRTS
jgi:hypothetical protein